MKLDADVLTDSTILILLLLQYVSALLQLDVSTWKDFGLVMCVMSIP